MAVRMRLDPIDRDIELFLSQDLSADARKATFARIAGEYIEQAKQINQRVLGRPPRYTVTVDGQRDASLNSVKADGGVIIAEFEVVMEELSWIGQQLKLHSPFKEGRYQRSHVLYADGVEADSDNVPPAETYIFANSQPYARKIERGLSSQAPDGVYQAVATLASQKFGNIAKVRFTYASLHNSKSRAERQPAIMVTVNA